MAGRLHGRLVLLVPAVAARPTPRPTPTWRATSRPCCTPAPTRRFRPTAGAAARAPRASTASTAKAARWATASRWPGSRSQGQPGAAAVRAPRRAAVAGGGAGCAARRRGAGDQRPQCCRPHRRRRLLGPHGRLGRRDADAGSAARRRAAHGDLSAAVFTLTPVSGTAVLTTAAGRKLGYVVVKDMIGQALAPLETAFARFKAEGVQDVVLDLRYNGGGLVSTGGTLASYVAGTRGSGRRYATLLYNDKRQRQQPELRLLDAGFGAGPAARLRADGPAHLLGQRAGRQRPARRGRRGGGDRRNQLRQAGRVRCPRAPAAAPTASSISRA